MSPGDCIRVIIYITTTCGYCEAARTLLTARGIAFRTIDLTEDAERRQQISQRAGNYRMVPMIFIDDQFIGGYVELTAMDRTGMLKKIN